MKFYDELMKNKFHSGVSNNDPKKSVYQNQMITINPLTDKEGLEKAYALPEKVYVHGDTLYVAGTSYLRDGWDDLKIPFSLTSKAQRYMDADALLAKNPQVTNLVGHSLGGASILELQKNHPETRFRTNTYGAPVASITAPDNIENHRYRNNLDPVSQFDYGAESNYKASAAKTMAMALFSGNPEKIYNGILDAHSYDNFDTNKVSDKPYTAQPMI